MLAGAEALSFLVLSCTVGVHVFGVKDVASANVRAVCWEIVMMKLNARLIFSASPILKCRFSVIVPDPSLPRMVSMLRRAGRSVDTLYHTAH